MCWERQAGSCPQGGCSTGKQNSHPGTARSWSWGNSTYRGRLWPQDAMCQVRILLDKLTKRWVHRRINEHPVINITGWGWASFHPQRSTAWPGRYQRGQLKGKGKGLAHRDISLHVRDIQKFEQQAVTAFTAAKGMPWDPLGMWFDAYFVSIVVFLDVGLC